MDRSTGNNSRCFDVDAAALGDVLDVALAVEWYPERVDDPAQKAFSDRNIDDRAGAFDCVAFLDGGVRSKNDDAHIVRLKIKRHAANTARKLDHLAGLHVVEAIDARNSVADGKDLSDLADL